MRKWRNYESVNVCRKCKKRHLHYDQTAGDLCAECFYFHIRGIETIEQYNEWLATKECECK